MSTASSFLHHNVFERGYQYSLQRAVVFCKRHGFICIIFLHHLSDFTLFQMQTHKPGYSTKFHFINNCSTSCSQHQLTVKNLIDKHLYHLPKQHNNYYTVFLFFQMHQLGKIPLELWTKQMLEIKVYYVVCEDDRWEIHQDQPQGEYFYCTHLYFYLTTIKKMLLLHYIYLAAVLLCGFNYYTQNI